MIISVPIDRIDPNPWQTRLSEPDPEYIKELAMDIAANGLLQFPVGRLMTALGAAVFFETPPDSQNLHDLIDLAGDYIQLAFGHNRLAAYKYMHNMSADTGKDKWARMPVDIRVLTDEQMATLAWSENEKRRDVNPIERALVIEADYDDIGEIIEGVEVSTNPGVEYGRLPDIDIDPNVERYSEPVRAQTPAAPTPGELEDLVRQARKLKLDVPAEYAKLKERLIEAAVTWVKNDEPGALLQIARNVSDLYPTERELEIEQIYWWMAKRVTEQILSNENYDSVDQMYERLDKTLDRLHLPQLKRGKTLDD